jgi:hypothetical protein
MRHQSKATRDRVQVVLEICLERHLDPEVVLGRGRSPRVVAERRKVMRQLQARYQWSGVEIARAFGRNPGAVNRLLRNDE